MKSKTDQHRSRDIGQLLHHREQAESVLRPFIAGANRMLRRGHCCDDCTSDLVDARDMAQELGAMLAHLTREARR